MKFSGSNIVFLSLLILLPNVAELFAYDTCATTKGQLCKFPFEFKGRRYFKCTRDYSKNGKAWCETYVPVYYQVVPTYDTSYYKAVPIYYGDCNSACDNVSSGVSHWV